MFVIVFRDQTLATVAESVRIKYTVGPTIPWYQEFLRYYFLTVEDSVDGSMTRRFTREHARMQELGDGES